MLLMILNKNHKSFACYLWLSCLLLQIFWQGRALAGLIGPWVKENHNFFQEIIMLGTLDFTSSKHWASFNFPQSTALVYVTYSKKKCCNYWLASFPVGSKQLPLSGTEGGIRLGQLMASLAQSAPLPLLLTIQFTLINNDLEKHKHV